MLEINFSSAGVPRMILVVLVMYVFLHGEAHAGGVSGGPGVSSANAFASGKNSGYKYTTEQKVFLMEALIYASQASTYNEEAINALDNLELIRSTTVQLLSYLALGDIAVHIGNIGLIAPQAELLSIGKTIGNLNTGLEIGIRAARSVNTQ